MAKGDIRTYYQADIVEVLDGFTVTRTYEDFEPYQRWMSDLMQQNRRCLLGAFMGSGKTACALHAVTECMRRGKVTKTLVIAPLNVAKNTWPDEIMDWDFARELTYTVIVGDVDSREAALDVDADIYFINRENLRWLYEKVGMAGWIWDCLIYDEATRLAEGDKRTKGNIRKDGTASRKRLSEFGYLTKVAHRFNYIWELSGTPAPRGVMGLWGPIYILDKGERLGRSKSAFEKRWFNYDPYKRVHEPHDHSEKEITEKLKDIMFCLQEEDYLELPPLIVKDRFVTLTPKQMQMYRKFERELALEELDVSANNSAVLANKLLQFANGSVYSDLDGDPQEEANLTGKPVAKHIHDAKLQELGSIFQEAAGRSVLIAYSYKFDVVAIKKRYPFVRIFGETPNDLQDWNKGKLKAMILHPASAGHGLNFQKGGNIAVWYGLNWSLELYQQFNRRLKRRGQEADHVWMYRILTRGTMDVKVAARLEEKAIDQDRITEPFTVRMKEVQEWVRRQAA
jgi:SNF2 family DNA or RNA helicase